MNLCKCGICADDCDYHRPTEDKIYLITDADGNEWCAVENMATPILFRAKPRKGYVRQPFEDEADKRAFIKKLRGA